MSAIPHALQLAESVNSEFFAPVGNALITSREAEDLLHSYYLPSVRQHLTAFDGDNTVAQPPQRTAGAAPLALLHRLRLRGNYCTLAGFTSGSWRYRPAASARRASPESSPSGAHTPSGHGAPKLSPRAGRSVGPLPIPLRHSAPPSARTCSYLACET